MKILFAALLIITSMTTVAQERTKEQWLSDAKAAAEELFNNYHAVCNGRVIVRAGSNRYYEFSGSKAEVVVLGEL